MGTARLQHQARVEALASRQMSRCPAQQPRDLFRRQRGASVEVLPLRKRSLEGPRVDGVTQQRDQRGSSILCAGSLSDDWMNFRKLLAPSSVGACPAPTGIQRKLSKPYLAKSYMTASRLTMVSTPWPRNHHHWLSSAGVSEVDSRPTQMGTNPATG